MAGPVSFEMYDFLKKVALATRQGALAWETTADPDVLVAPLGAEYSVRLEQSSDFEGLSPEPDHTLTLLKNRRQLFSLDRRDFQDSGRFREIFVSIMRDPETNAFKVLTDLWTGAYFKASKISEELDAVNRILDSRLRRE